MLVAQQPTTEVALTSVSSVPDGWGDAPVQTEEYLFWALLLGASLLALIFAFKFFREMKQADPGTPRMVEIADYVTTGARAYLKQQYFVVSIFFVIVFGLCWSHVGQASNSFGFPSRFSPAGFGLRSPDILG